MKPLDGKMASPGDAHAKKDVLTLAQLASYDDLLTDALIDHVRRRFRASISASFVLVLADVSLRLITPQPFAKIVLAISQAVA